MIQRDAGDGTYLAYDEPVLPVVYTPLMICERDSTSFHESDTAAHVDSHGSTTWPCSIRMASREEHEAVGWGTAQYPFWIGLRPLCTPWDRAAMPCSGTARAGGRPASGSRAS